jgi:hypothetical protein
MRGRIALQKYFVRDACEVLFCFASAFGVRACPRAAFNDIVAPTPVLAGESLAFSVQTFLSVQPRARCVRKSAYDKKHWNATARDLSDSRRNHYALSHRHRSSRDGSCGAHSGRFDFDRQIKYRRFR